jgi:transposase
MIEYKAELRGVDVSVIGRFTPTSKPCSQCGQLHDMPLGKEVMDCDCGNVMDRDLNAAINIDFLGRAALLRDPKRTQESGKTSASVDALAMTT